MILPEKAPRCGTGHSFSPRDQKICVGGDPERLVPHAQSPCGSARYLVGPQRPTRAPSCRYLWPSIGPSDKSQGAERKTYLPMPFAHVVGGDPDGASTSAGRVASGSTSARSDDRDARGSRRRPAADGALELALYDGTPPRGARRVPRRGRARRGAARLGVPALGERQRVEHAGRGPAPGGRAPRPRHPGRQRRHRGVERRDAPSRASRDARSAVRDGASRSGSRTSSSRPDGAWPDPKGMVDELHAREIRVHLWQIPLMKLRPHPDRAGRRRMPTPRCATGVLIREPGARRIAAAVPQPRLVVPARRSCPTSPTSAPRAGGPTSAATSSRRSASTGSRPTAASTPGDASWSTSTAACGDEENNTLPRRSTRRPTATCSGRAGKAPVTFSRAGFTGSPGARRLLGGRRELDLGGVPLVALRGAQRRGMRHRLLGLGPRRLQR